MKKKNQIHKEQPQEVEADKNIPDIVKISKQQWSILFCLFIAVFIAYLPALHKEFVNLDDNTYLTQNPDIANFSFSKIPAAFSHYYCGQYSPAVSVACGIINMMVGFSPFYYNIIAVVLHLITIMLVFNFIWILCRNFLVAFITAALFGIATIQVESVAWIAAVYKICTYSIFFLLSLIVYIRYIKTNKKRDIIISVILFFISCLFKEQAVSLAIALVAIDIYLGRKWLSKKVILEKIPFFIISVIFGIITMAAAKSFHQDGINISSFTIADRFIYASYALCAYIYKLFVPINLSFYYTYFPLDNSRLLYSLYSLFLVIMAGLYWYAIKKRNKFILFGGLFFLLNILFSLTLQIIAVRPTFMADRYDYLASIGIFFMVAKGVDILIEKKLVKRYILTIIFISFFMSTAFITYGRNKVWKNSLTLWNDVISKDQDIAIAYYFRANAKYDRGDFEGALDDYNKTIALHSNNAVAYYNRGVLKSKNRDKQGALEDFNKSINLRPGNSAAYLNRGSLKASMGDKLGAIEDYNKAIAISPAYEVYYNRGTIKKELGDKSGAIEDFNQAITLRPNFAESYLAKGLIMFSTGNYQEAIVNFTKVIEINPKNEEAYNNRGSALNATGNFAEALLDFTKAIEINPAYINAYMNRAAVKYNLADFRGVTDDCNKALELKPGLNKAVELKAEAQQELQKERH